MSDRFRFRVWDPEDKIYTSFPWFARAHNSHLEVDYPLVLEQSTGLRDKNGTLIFEGDVLRRGTNGDIKKIIYCQGGFGWLTNYDSFVSFAGHPHLEEILQNHEIIGNIHDEHFREVTKMIEEERKEDEDDK